MSWGQNSKRSWGGNTWGDDNDWKAKQSRSDNYGDWKYDKDSLDADLDVYFGRVVKDKSKESLDSQLDAYFASGSKAADAEDSRSAGAAAVGAQHPESSKEAFDTFKGKAKSQDKALDDQLDGYFSKKAASPAGDAPAAAEKGEVV